MIHTWSPTGSADRPCAHHVTRGVDMLSVAAMPIGGSRLGGRAVVTAAVGERVAEKTDYPCL